LRTIGENVAIATEWYRAPCGDLLLGSYGGKLCMCDWATRDSRSFVLRRLSRTLGAAIEERHSTVLALAREQLDEYFHGRRTTFDVPLLLIGTDFQKAVWQHLMTIPYGTTLSYGTMARQMGLPRAVRAIASANRANAISIFIPCHRVIGGNGKLVGYGGGLEAKRFLLDLEMRAQRANPSLF